MIGTDEEDGPTEQEVEYDLDLDGLVQAAAGDSVTASRLRGDERYFPDCRPYLHEDQQPHHLIPLSTSGFAFRAQGMEREYSTTTGLAGTHTDLSASASVGAVAVCAESELLAVVADSFCEVPYASLKGLLWTGNQAELHGAGNKDYVLDVADRAEDHEVAAGVDYLRRQVRSAGTR